VMNDCGSNKSWIENFNIKIVDIDWCDNYHKVDLIKVLTNGINSLFYYKL